MYTQSVDILRQRTGTQWLSPVQLSAGVLQRLAAERTTYQRVQQILKQLSADDYLNYMASYYDVGLAQFGSAWGYADLLTLLLAATRAVQPKNYLEIGVRRGRSVGMVVAECPSVNVFGFDMWMANYAGMENPGAAFVQEELQRLGHTGLTNFVSGNSHETVPQFLHANPELYFDLITVDGDHSEEGALLDLKNVLPRLKVGGVLLLDDVCHPQHLYLGDVWNKLVTSNSQFSAGQYTELGYGIAYAVRREI